MTRAFDNRTARRIKLLLGSVGVESMEEAKQNVEAFEHNWRQPRYFSRDQMTELKSFAGSLAAAASEKFTQFYQTDFAVTTDSISQHFANDFVKQISEEKSPTFFLLFGDGSAKGDQNARPWGLVGIPQRTAMAWTTQSLGQNESEEEQERTLSQLESSLLLDIAALFVQALSDSYENRSLNVIGQVVSGEVPFELEDTKELCRMTFNTKAADSEDAPEKAFLLMLCDKLEPATKIIEQTAKTLSPEDASRAIMQHLKKMPVPIAVRLGSASITFEELMNLAADDIIVLDTKVNEPVDLIFEEIKLFHARPAKSQGKYAIAITEPVLPKRRQI